MPETITIETMTVEVLEWPYSLVLWTAPVMALAFVVWFVRRSQRSRP